MADSSRIGAGGEASRAGAWHDRHLPERPGPFENGRVRSFPGRNPGDLVIDVDRHPPGLR